MIGPPQTASEGDDLWVWLSRHFVPLSSHCTHISVCNSVWLYILLLFWCHSIIIIDLAGTVQHRILMSDRLFSNRFQESLVFSFLTFSHGQKLSIWKILLLVWTRHLKIQLNLGYIGYKQLCFTEGWVNQTVQQSRHKECFFFTGIPPKSS